MTIERTIDAIIGRRALGDVRGARALAAAVNVDDVESGTVAARSRLLFEWAISELLSGEADAARALSQRTHALDPRGVAGRGAVALLSILDAWRGDVAAARRWRHQMRRNPPLDAVTHERLRMPLAAVDLILSWEQDAASDVLAGVRANLDDGHHHELWTFTLWARTRGELAVDPAGALARVDQAAARRSIDVAGNGAASFVLQRCALDALVAHDVAEAGRRLRDAAGPSWVHVAPRAQWARALGRLDDVDELVAAHADDRTLSPYDRAWLLLLQADADIARSRPAAAVLAYDRGRRIADTAGLRSVFAALSADARDRIAEATGRQVPVGTPPAPVVGPLTALTARERVVLRKLAHHATLADVARALSVSINTVKKQSVSIYAKLGVHSRTDALRQARAIGMLKSDPTGERTGR